MDKINRIGEENYNNFGSKMVIKEYKDCHNSYIYFPEYEWISGNIDYRNFKNGNVKCPYEKRIFGIGYIGEGKYKVMNNNKYSKEYITWKEMLRRCYDKNYKEKHPTYRKSECHKKWHNFQNFGEWFKENYYTVNNETMCLDKDILIKKNKIYNSNTCIFVPERINMLFIKRDNDRGNYPIGVNKDKRHNRFQARCSIYDFDKRKIVRVYLGYYKTPEEAFEVYKQFKESHIKKVANYYKDKIPQKLYNAMYQYEVEITD